MVKNYLKLGMKFYGFIGRKILWTISLSFLFLFVKAQERTLIGKVVDENSEGLPGVNIIIKGTTIGTITDFEGL